MDARAEYPSAPVDLVINATSLGLRPGDGLPFDASRFALNQAGAAYDMIYQPAETPFLRAAASAGCAVSNGLGMLLYQGAKALEIWQSINEKNLYENILPTRQRARLILRKGPNHKIESVALRRI